MLFQQSWRSSHICWALLAAFPSLCGPTHPKPSQLGWGRMIVEAMSSYAAIHNSPWSNSPYTSWRCVLGDFPVGKTNDSHTKRKPDGMTICCRMLWWLCWLSVPWILNKSLTVSPAKHYHTSFSVYLLCISQRHSCWNGNVYYWHVLVVVSLQQFDYEALISSSLLWTVDVSDTWTLWSIYLGCNFWGW
jgi:hypothetical protein